LRHLGRIAAAFALIVLAPAVLAGCAGKPRPRVAFDPDQVPEAYAASTAALMWPGASRAFQITPAGDLFNGDWMVDIRASADAEPVGAPRAIAYEGRWMPVAHWVRRSGDVRWEFEAVALPSPPPRDTGLIVSLVARATNTGTKAHTARLELTIARPASAPLFVAFDAPEAPLPNRRWNGGGREPAYGWVDGGAADSTAAIAWSLGAGASRSARFVLPAYPTEARALGRWATKSHQNRADEVRDYWNREVAGGTAFTLHDPEVEDALRAALVVLLSCREQRGELWVPIGNPFQYRDVWLRDGARAVAALAVSGHGAVARDLARGLAELQWPNGPFLSQRGQLDGTGQALWAFEQSMLRSSPSDSIARYAEAALGAWRWNEWQRSLGRASGWRFGTMMPFGDPRDGELVTAQLVGNDAWMLAGYRSAVRLLRAAGRNAEAAAVESTRVAYLGDFVRLLNASGRRDIPPSWQGDGYDWGNLAAPWPCMVLPASDPHCAALAQRVWAEAGGTGLGTYGSSDSLHAYVAADLGTWALLAGRRAEADRVLEALLHWRSASGGAGEIFTRNGAYGTNLPPHATAAAALVSLVRNALVFDDGDSLQLTLGARERWWSHGQVLRAPTRWGSVDLDFDATPGEARWKWTPVPVWTTLTLPPGSRAASRPAPPLVLSESGETLLAPPGTGHAEIALARGTALAPGSATSEAIASRP
jgi:hypothetical protein